MSGVCAHVQLTLNYDYLVYLRCLPSLSGLFLDLTLILETTEDTVVRPRVVQVVGDTLDRRLHHHVRREAADLALENGGGRAVERVGGASGETKVLKLRSLTSSPG